MSQVSLRAAGLGARRDAVGGSGRGPPGCGSGPCFFAGSRTCGGFGVSLVAGTGGGRGWRAAAAAALWTAAGAASTVGYTYMIIGHHCQVCKFKFAQSGTPRESSSSEFYHRTRLASLWSASAPLRCAGTTEAFPIAPFPSAALLDSHTCRKLARLTACVDSQPLPFSYRSDLQAGRAGRAEELSSQTGRSALRRGCRRRPLARSQVRLACAPESATVAGQSSTLGAPPA